MPIEINELHIKVNVEKGQQDLPMRKDRQAPKKTDAIVDVCVEKVLEILNQENQR